MCAMRNQTRVPARRVREHLPPHPGHHLPHELVVGEPPEGLGQDDGVEQHRLAPVALHRRRPLRRVHPQQQRPGGGMVAAHPLVHGREEAPRLGARVPVPEQPDARRRRQHLRLLDQQVQHVLRQGLADGPQPRFGGHRRSCRLVVLDAAQVGVR